MNTNSQVEAWHLPWGRETVSHAILDINRGCNIACRSCYNTRPGSFKRLDEIAAELAELQARRKMGYVSLVGGEVLLHPELDEIIRFLKGQGLAVQIFSNGLLLNEERAERLRGAGVDIVYLHIERGQSRPDLAADPTAEDLRRLWDEKTELLARHGIDAGLAMTAFADRLSDVREVVEYVADSPQVHYLLVTLFRDVERIASLRGNIDAGIRGEHAGSARTRTDTLTNHDIIRYLRSELGLRPFAYLGSNQDRNDPRWLSYFVATRRGGDGTVTRYSAKASAFEKFYCTLAQRISGKYPMYQQQNAAALRAQLFLNAFLGGDGAGNMRFLFGSLRSGGELRAKRLLFQCPAQLEYDGTLTHCLNCPDAVVKNGGLVPLCISDRFEAHV